MYHDEGDWWLKHKYYWWWWYEMVVVDESAGKERLIGLFKGDLSELFYP